MEFLQELWRFIRVRKKMLVTAAVAGDGPVRQPHAAHAGLGGCPLRLHAVLKARCVSSASRRSITTARCNRGRRAHRCRRPRRSASPGNGNVPQTAVGKVQPAIIVNYILRVL